MARKTKEDAEHTRRLILDTAECVFGDKGVARTTLSDIATAAGLTRGAIYGHFKNKAELFDAMCDRVVLPLEDFRSRAREEHLTADPIGFLRLWSLHALYSLTGDHHSRQVFDVVLHKCEFVEDMGRVLERQQACAQTCVELMRHAFELAERRGLLRDGVVPEVAAFGLQAYIGGLMSSWLKASDYFPLSDRSAALIDFYLSGVLKPAVPISPVVGGKPNVDG